MIPMRVTVRGFADGVLLFENTLELADEAAIDEFVPALAEKHAMALADHRLHVIEIEFLDEPDPGQRFFKFGTDPRGMIMPIAFDLTDLT